MAKRKARPESWGAIRRLPSGRYQGSYVGPDGSRYNAPHTFDAKDDARAWLLDRRIEIQRGTWHSPADLALAAAEQAKAAQAERFGAYAATWVEQRVNSRGEPLRPKTRLEYTRQLRNGLSEFADDRLSAITPARVRAWHGRRMQAGATAAGAEARLLRAVLNTAIVDGILDANPVPSNLTRSSTGVKHRPPTIDELGVILDTIDDRFRFAIILAAYGGLRLSEWRALRRSDLTLSDGRVYVTIERTAQFLRTSGWHVGPPKSAEGVRTVALPTALTAAAEHHLQEYVGPFDGDLIFPFSRSGFMHDRPFNSAWDAARVAAGVRYRIDDQQDGTKPVYQSVVREHDLRAFAGTTFAQSGATLRETMRFLGHSTTDAAMVYQHAAEDRLHEIADRMPLPTPSRNGGLGRIPV